MNPLLAALPVAAGAALAAVLLVGNGGGRPAEAPGTPLRLAAADAGGAAAEPQVVAPARRNVTPAGVTPGPAVDGPMERLPVPEPPPPPPRWERYFGVVAVEAGRLDLGGRVVRLAGIAPPAVDRMCGSGAAAWPCGRAALTAFRMFLRGRAVECLIPRGEEAGPCRIGPTDLGAWLAAQGWAEADDAADGALAEASAEAACAGRGLWRGAAGGPACAR